MKKFTAVFKPTKTGEIQFSLVESDKASQSTKIEVNNEHLLRSAAYTGDILWMLTESSTREYSKFLWNPYRKQGDTISLATKYGNTVEVTLLD